MSNIVNRATQCLELHKRLHWLRRYLSIIQYRADVFWYPIKGVNLVSNNQVPIWYSTEFEWDDLPYVKGPSWSWLYGSWIYNYICSQCLSPLTLWVQIPLRRGVFDTTLCDKVCQWHETGRCFSPDTPVSSTNKTDRHDIAEILLKALTPIELSNYRAIHQSFITGQA